MTYPYHPTNTNENHYAVAELEAPQARPAERPNPDSVAFELPGESSAPAPSHAQEAASPVGSISIPQANPWPFYLDDAANTKQSPEARHANHLTTSTSEHPANPWPFHGIESDSLDGNKTPNHEDELQNTNMMAFAHIGPDKKPSSGCPVDSLKSPDVTQLDKAATESDYAQHRQEYHGDQPGNSKIPGSQQINKESWDTVLPVRQGSPHVNAGPSLSGPTPSGFHSSGIVPQQAGAGNIGSAVFGSHNAQSNANNAATPDISPHIADTMGGLYLEHSSQSNSSVHQQAQNQASLHGHPPSQLAWQPSARPYSQPPPPYSLQASPAFGSTNQSNGSYFQGQSSSPSNTSPAQPFMTPPTPSLGTFTQRPLSSSEPGLRPGAPPLPPRSPRQTNPVVGLSDGPHSNVAFPPPPKRHNAPPSRYPPPLPQRPTTASSSSFSSSKFLGSSSAKKWIEKTNQAIEDTLDAVLQGPAGHPGRPAYVSRPPQPSQSTPPSSGNRYNPTRFNSSDSRL